MTRFGGLSQIDGTDRAKSQSCRLNFPVCGWSHPFLIWIWRSIHQTLLNYTHALPFLAPLSNQSFTLSFTRAQMDLHPIFYHWAKWQGRGTLVCIGKANAYPAVRQNGCKCILKRKFVKEETIPAKLPCCFKNTVESQKSDCLMLFEIPERSIKCTAEEATWHEALSL